MPSESVIEKKRAEKKLWKKRWFLFMKRWAKNPRITCRLLDLNLANL